MTKERAAVIMIGVIDYKAGNGPSVINALRSLNVEAALVKMKDEIRLADALILPGVGSAQATMDSLRELNCIDAISDVVRIAGKPFLGICVGLQILFDHSEEGNVDCLGWLHGKVKKFDGNKVRVPQIGWNATRFTGKKPINNGLRDEEHFYFVNSYYVVPDNEDIVLAKTEYGIEFCSMIASDNIFATQFHAEKSGEAGLTMLRNFVDMTAN